MEFSRRDILRIGAFALLWLALGGLGSYLVNLFRSDHAQDEDGGTPGQEPDGQRPKPTPRQEPEIQPEQGWMRPLGHTGTMVSLFGLGGGGIIAQAQRRDEALELIDRALDLGVNFIDTAPTYGASELHIGEAIQNRREEVFLATKTLDRSYDETMRLFEGSLRHLQTSYIDLYQIHGIRDEEDVRTVLQPGGAAQALRELKDEGVVRFTGITGHRDPAPLRLTLQREDFDCVLIPLNPAEVHFRSFRDQLLDHVSGRNMGIIAMKVAAYGRLLGSENLSMQQLLRYVCTLPISTAIVGLSSVEELQENVRICRDFVPYADQEMSHLEQLAKLQQEAANFFKTEW